MAESSVSSSAIASSAWRFPTATKSRGFTKLLDSGVVIFAAGPTSFILTNFYEKAFAENYMMQLMVDDLDAWWAHIASLDLADKFGVQAPRAPELQPWGLRIAYVFDPCGVLWHVAQRREGKPADAWPQAV